MLPRPKWMSCTVAILWLWLAQSVLALDVPVRQVILETRFIEASAVNTRGDLGIVIFDSQGPQALKVNQSPEFHFTPSGFQPTGIDALLPVTGSNYFLVNGSYQNGAEFEFLSVIDGSGAEQFSLLAGSPDFDAYPNPQFGYAFAAKMPSPEGSGPPVKLIGAVVGDPGQIDVAPSFVVLARENGVLATSFPVIDYVPDAASAFAPFPGAYNHYPDHMENSLGVFLPLNAANPQPGYPAGTPVIDLQLAGGRGGQGQYQLAPSSERPVLTNPLQLTVRPTIDASGRIALSFETVYEAEPINSAVALVGGLTNIGGSPRQVAAVVGTSVRRADQGTPLAGDMDGDSDVDHDDIDAFGVPYLSNVPLVGSLFTSADANKNGKVTLEDLIFITPHLVRELEQKSSPAKGLDPDYLHPGFGFGVVVQGDTIPDCPDFVVGGLFAIRGNNHGVGVVGVASQDFQDQAIVLLNDAGIHCILRKGDDLGDGSIGRIYDVSNVNSSGQFAVMTQLPGGRFAVYQMEGAATGAAANPDWLLQGL